MAIEKAIPMIPLKQKLKNFKDFFNYAPPEALKDNLKEEATQSFYESIAYFGERLAPKLNPFGFALTYLLTTHNLEHNQDIMSDESINLEHLPCSSFGLEAISGLLPPKFMENVYWFIDRLNEHPLGASSSQIDYK